MKDFKLTIIITILLTNSLIAQKISIGPEVGINLINTEKTELGTDYQLGMHFGIQVRYKLSDHFSLSSGVYYTQKKKKYTFIDTTTTPDLVGGLFGGLLGGNTSGEANVYTTTKGLVSEMLLEVPILVHYEVHKIDFFAGPYTTFLIGVNRKEVYTTESTAMDPSSLIPGGLGGLGGLFSGLTSPNPTPIESTSKDGLTSTDIGVIAGLGYHMEHLQFNLMYTYGFLDYRSNAENENLINHEIIRFSVVYLFDLKKKTASNSARFE